MNGNPTQLAQSQTTEDKLKKRRDSIFATLKADGKERIRGLCEDIDAIDETIPLDIKRKNYMRNHEFLTQQIDERSHQVWMLGSLFVPLSFLIFMYTATSQYPPLSDRFLLMFVSLTSYLVFYYFYHRITFLNDLSYDYLHAYEIELGLSGHLTLKKYWDESRFLQVRVYAFVLPLFILSVSWTCHLLPQVVPYVTSLGNKTDIISQLSARVLPAICLAPSLLALIVHSIIFDATNVKRVQSREQEAREQRKAKQTSRGSGVIAPDEIKLVADASGSQQPSGSGATPQTTAIDQDKKEDEEAPKS